MWTHSGPDHPASHCFHRHQHTEYEAAGRTHVKCLEHMPEVQSLPFISAHHSCPKLIQRIQFRYLSVDELIPGATLGYTLRTVTITPSLYLSYLFSCFFANNGTAVRGSLQHIDQVLEEGITPFLHVPVGANHNTSTVPRTIDALFVCTGLGSRFLGGVEDKHVYAVRGQTILLRAPWVRSGRAFDEQDGTCTYVMPRKNGDVGLPVAAREMDH